MNVTKKLKSIIQIIRNYSLFKRRKKLCEHLCKGNLVDFDKNLFKDKRVAIVGGADSVLKEKLGYYIDNFDVVVRVNKGVDVIDLQQEYVGKRTDVLFHAFYEREDDKGSSPITIKLWEEKEVKLIVFSRNFRQNLFAASNFLDFLKKNNNKINYSQLPLSFCKEELEILNPVSPTTGFTAINSVIKCKPTEVYLTGITFFKTPHNNLYREFEEADFDNVFNKLKNHNADLEYAFVKHLYLKYPNIIKPDNTLQQIFDTH